MSNELSKAMELGEAYIEGLNRGIKRALKGYQFYRFPGMAKLENFTNTQQANYVCKEAIEAVEACSIMNTFEPSTKDWLTARHDYGMELMDVIHAAETALRIEFPAEEIAQLWDNVVEKNNARGYYG